MTKEERQRIEFIIHALETMQTRGRVYNALVLELTVANRREERRK